VAQSLGPAPQEGPDPAKETAEKIADPMPKLKVEQGGIDRAVSRIGERPRGA